MKLIQRRGYNIDRVQKREKIQKSKNMKTQKEEEKRVTRLNHDIGLRRPTRDITRMIDRCDSLLPSPPTPSEHALMPGRKGRRSSPRPAELPKPLGRAVGAPPSASRHGGRTLHPLDARLTSIFLVTPEGVDGSEPYGGGEVRTSEHRGVRLSKAGSGKFSTDSCCSMGSTPTVMSSQAGGRISTPQNFTSWQGNFLGKGEGRLPTYLP